MVRQAAKGLCADYVLRTRLGKCRHFSCDKPALAHFNALMYVLVGAPSQVLKIMRRLENAVILYHLDLLLLILVEHIIADLEEEGRSVLFIVQLCIVHRVRSTVEHEIEQPRNVRLAPLREQKLVEVVVGKRGILNIYLPHYADNGLFDLASGYRRKVIKHRLVYRLRHEVVIRIHKLYEPVLPACDKLVCHAGRQLIGLALVIKQHEHIAVKHRIDKP